ncbi:MbtH family NRPS accessory protein, partial [Streptomyces sp. C]|uniref:MbtH family NRPS accessory protein n=1 Tax=Streptomyces sp. C TaxID=253839 RepID=UPI0001B577CF
MSEQQNGNRSGDGGGQAETRYRVVLNDEEQYSIWWSERELPAGWTAEAPRAPARNASPGSRGNGPTCAPPACAGG